MKIRINDADIAYDDHGIGQPILFLHAFPLNREMWQGQIAALLNEQRFRLVSLDWRGFGESESATTHATHVTMELLADDVAALMDALGMQQAILCGLSLGGYVAFAFLRKYPQRVRGLLLADTKPDADTEEAKANRARVAQLAESEGPGAIADLQIPNLLAFPPQSEVETHVRRMIEAATGSGIAAVSRGMAQRVDANDLLAQISIPTLVLVGEQDALTPPVLARKYAAQIPGAQFVIIPQAGHLSNLEQAEAFFEAMHNFLRVAF